MGCDIHLFVERRNQHGSWEPVLVRVPCWRSRRPDHGLECYSCKGSGLEPFSDRNYILFSLLADVRNQYDLNPISPRRGLPPDLSYELRSLASEDPDLDADQYEEKFGNYWLGEHSFSYLTLAELLVHDWQQTFVKEGWVDAEEFQQFLKTGRPNSYSRGVSGGSVCHVSNAKMDSALRRNKRVDSWYTLVSWQITHAEAAGRFYSEFLPKLRELGAHEDVRIVFGFDN